MKKNLLFLLGAFVALTSCSTDETSVAPAGKNEISFTLDGIKTRVVDNQFEAGDAISVNAFDNADLYASAEYSYSNGAFTSATPIAYDGSDSKSLSYQAAYPAVENFASAFSFEVAEDQTGEGYEASDLLVANVAATTNLKPALSFYHTMSSIIINVNGTNVASSAIAFNAKKSVACNVTSATYVAEGDEATITAAQNGNVGFKAVLAPQTFAAGQTVATLTTATGSYEWTISADKVFQSGKQYLYTWTVDEVTGENSIEFTGIINDWDSVDGGDINGGGDGGDVTPDQGDSKTITFDGSELPAAYPADETITVDGVDFVLNLVANFSSMYETSGPIQFKKSDAYLYNSTAVENITEVVITLAPEGTQYNNFVVYAGDTAYPTEVEATSSQEGDVCTYYIPEGSKFISVVNPSNYTAYAFQIDVVVGDGGSTGEPGEPDEPADPSVESNIDEFLAAEVGASFTLENVTIDYVNAAGIYVSADDKSILVYDGDLVDLVNVGDLVTLTGTVSEYNGAKQLKFPVTVDSSVAGDSSVEALTPAISDIIAAPATYMNQYVLLSEVAIDGTDMTNAGGTIPYYNKFAVADAPTADVYNVYGYVSAYSGNAQIYPTVFEFVRAGESGNEGGEDADASTVEIFASDFTNGGSNTDNGQDGFPVEDTEVVGDFTFTFVDGSTPTRNWWYKEAWQLRFYTGSVTTISSEKTITKIEFDGYPEFTSEDGAYANKVWEGSANSVVFNGTKSGKVDKITITYAE